MKIHRLLACWCFLAFLTTHVSAQSDRPREASADADAAFASGNFYDAIPLYKKAFSKESKKDKKAQIVFQTAECYRMIVDVADEIVWYDKAIKAGYKDPIAILYYADALKQAGKYDEAIVQYTNFKKASPDDNRGDIGVQSSQLAQRWKDHPKRYKVENLSPLNTKYSDFATCFASKDHRT
jgi:peptidoglycan-associated lipoprotein